MFFDSLTLKTTAKEVSKVKRTIFIGSLVSLLIASLVGCGLLPTGPEIGEIQISSVPPGATIWLDGECTDKSTPETFEGVDAGKHQIRLVKADYVDWTKEVTVDNGKTAYITAYLVGMPATLIVLSDPSGASIWLDWDDTGQTTPDTLTGLEPKSHNVKLKLEGYHDWSGCVDLEPNQTDTLDVVLEQLPGPATLIINSDPVGADIWLNNEPTGVSTPDTISNLSPGYYMVKLTKPGYADWRTSVTLDNNEVEVIEADLRRLPMLVVSSNPSGAQIWLDGEDTGKTTPDTLQSLSTGYCQLKLSLFGYFDWEESYHLTYDQVEVVDVPLEQLPEVIFAYTRNDTLWQIDTGSGLPATELADDYREVLANPLAWSPDGRYLSYVCDSGICILRESGGQEALLEFAESKRAYDFSWSNDGTKQANGNYHEGIYVYDVISGNLERIYTTGGYTYDHNPVYSPGDSLIARVHHEYGYRAWIRLMRADGSNSHTVSERFSTSYDEHLDLAWISPDEVLFKVSNVGIYLLNVRTSESEVVVAQTVSRLRVSANGKRYAFISGSGRSLYWQKVGDWSPANLVSYDIGTIYHLDWGPDNDFLICWTSEGVYLVNLHGSAQLLVPVNGGTGGVSVKPN